MEDGDDLDYDESKHDLLLSAVSKLDKTQHIKQPSRNEPTNLSSEFNLIKSSNKLDLNNVVKVLENTAHSVQISKKLKKTHDVSKVLQKPLEKPQRERIKRSTGYEETKKKVGRWDPVVARARTVDYTSFPLKHISHKLTPTTEFLSKLTLKSPLEMELDEVDPQPVVEEKEEEEKLYPMSYEEMIEHRQHTAKLRAQQSFNAAKAKRQSKIKSKKYHRILKKERLRQQIKEFEELQKTDPEEALKKLEELEKARALERHTLRHKNTGKWAKNLVVRAKYDKDVRQQLAEQLSVGRSLTKKTQNESSDDEEIESSENVPDLSLTQDPSNPWMLQSSQKSNVDAEFDFGYKKYIKDRMFKRKAASDSESEEEQEQDKATDFSEIKDKLTALSNQPDTEEPKDKITSNKNEDKTSVKSKPKKQKISHKIIATSNWTVAPCDNKTAEQKKPSTDILDEFETLENNLNDKVEKKLRNLRRNLKNLKEKTPITARNPKTTSEVDSLEYLKMKQTKIRPIIDEELNETNTKDTKTARANEISKAAEIVNKNLPAAKNDSASSTANIDPSRFIQAKPKFLNTAQPTDGELDCLDDDEQVVPRVNIEEVFEEDDVVASFRKEKEDEADKDKPKDIDLSLPGWGSWGGKGVKVPKKRRNRFIKAPPTTPRRDENKGDIIIKEYKEPKLASHKVSEVPFPFTSVKDYEASIRAPLGNTFIPENAHRKLIRPSVITKSGTIIEPMDEEELLVPKNRSFANQNVIKIFANK